MLSAKFISDIKEMRLRASLEMTFYAFLIIAARQKIVKMWMRISMWPDWTIYWTLGNFLKPLATIILPKSNTFLGKFLKVSKSIIFLVKSFLGNFYRHLAIFYGHTEWDEHLFGHQDHLDEDGRDSNCGSRV